MLGALIEKKVCILKLDMEKFRKYLGRSKSDRIEYISGVASSNHKSSGNPVTLSSRKRQGCFQSTKDTKPRRVSPVYVSEL
uniref:Uncharacterized protein n=1 Tax=Vespula pensylvanica TaxID=30213 RepID=A0A834P3Y9_VESPE|nr:hypothetical protein H0235_006951 [Vespula pensylvanica]